ncbi:hypothetical protein C9J12_28440 [Photobacterium frigidiphilum]|uniref:Uncharacterized protein n=1 Tax=Photobacterium frigidiphilum TaxID=264736 RepID=A0A2T3J6B3_9GAMM|nr:hypothetical protein C9J12_28440 [Photobacterium frigidiphilum]
MLATYMMSLLGTITAVTLTSIYSIAYKYKSLYIKLRTVIIYAFILVISSASFYLLYPLVNNIKDDYIYKYFNGNVYELLIVIISMILTLFFILHSLDRLNKID